MNGRGALIEMEQKGCELIIHDHDRNLWATMVGWVDVPYCDWGDFKRWHAIDIPGGALVMWTLLGVCRSQGSLFEPRFLSQGCIFGKNSLAKGIFSSKVLSQGYIFVWNPLKNGILGLN